MNFTMNHARYLLLGLTVLMLLGDIGDIIGKYQNWEFVNTTAFVGEIMRTISKTGIAALTGNLFPSPKAGQV